MQHEPFGWNVSSQWILWASATLAENTFGFCGFRILHDLSLHKLYKSLHKKITGTVISHHGQFFRDQGSCMLLSDWVLEPGVLSCRAYNIVAVHLEVTPYHQVAGLQVLAALTDSVNVWESVGVCLGHALRHALGQAGQVSCFVSFLWGL